MKISLATTQQIEALAAFLARTNARQSQHIGYCGTNEEGIIATLREDFVREQEQLSFAILENNLGEISAAIGLDLDEDTAEVWGPFHEQFSLEEEAALWQFLIQHFSEVKQFQFFVNELNVQQQQFLLQLQATKEGEHLVLKIERNQLPTQIFDNLKSFEVKDEVAFCQTHNEVFPNTYFAANTILSRLSDTHQLWLLKNEQQQIIGYCYFEIEPEFGEASLEYIAIAPDFQNQGLGTKLLIETLQKIFAFKEIEEIKLCVNNGNNRANHVYVKAGFEKQHVLISYSYKI